MDEKRKEGIMMSTLAAKYSRPMPLKTAERSDVAVKAISINRIGWLDRVSVSA